MVILSKDHIQVNNYNIPCQLIHNRIYADISNVAVLVTGSLVEELGNSYSDLDILVLCDTLPSNEMFDINRHSCHGFTWYARSVDKISGSWSTHDYFGEQGLHIDIEYVDVKSIQKDVKEFNQRVQKLISDEYLLSEPFIRIPVFSNRKKQIFHRILTGLPLIKSNGLNNIKDTINLKKLSLMNYLDTRLGYSNFKDILGFYHAGDYDSTLYLLRKRLLEQFHGLVHLAFNNNINDKWRVAYLEKYKNIFPELITSINHVINTHAIKEEQQDDLINIALVILDKCFMEAQRMLKLNFSDLISCQNLFKAQKKLYARKDMNHQQIKMAFSYEERFYSEKFNPLINFFSTKKQTII